MRVPQTRERPHDVGMAMGERGGRLRDGGRMLVLSLRILRRPVETFVAEVRRRIERLRDFGIGLAITQSDLDDTQ